MATNSTIEWTEMTWNPVTGCSKTSEGCRFCYAERMARRLHAMGNVRYANGFEVTLHDDLVDLPRRKFPSVEQAKMNLKRVAERLEHLRTSGAPRQEVRTAECDWFGAEETVALARSSTCGEINQVLNTILPAEVQVFKIDETFFVNIPGELFVEYSLEIKKNISQPDQA